MRTIISVLFVSILAGSYAYYGGDKFTVANKDILAKQQFLFEVLQHPYQPGVSIYKPEYLNIVNSFNFENSFSLFKNVDAVKQFWFFYQKGLIPYNELFSISNDFHRQQAIALFHVFYYAKGKRILFCSLLITDQLPGICFRSARATSIFWMFFY